MNENRDWLMVVDLQPAFSHPDSPWFTPSLAEASARIAQLVPLFGERVLFTRFVPPAVPDGSWARYYEKWPFALRPEADWLWAVDAPWRQHASMASHTFSKWLPDAYERFGPQPRVTLCGVSADCCVLATALAAVDGGAQVRLVADACAAKSPAVQEGALSIMAARAPMLRITTTAEECAHMTRQETLA
ncbi:cysteine hydrolase family protein [Teichococcus wenyumeiae]|nr:isochorismatase family protein [Pseudoroseomonas wenyumeiae]